MSLSGGVLPLKLGLEIRIELLSAHARLSRWKSCSVACLLRPALLGATGQGRAASRRKVVLRLMGTSTQNADDGDYSVPPIDVKAPSAHRVTHPETRSGHSQHKDSHKAIESNDWHAVSAWRAVSSDGRAPDF